MNDPLLKPQMPILISMSIAIDAIVAAVGIVLWRTQTTGPLGSLVPMTGCIGVGTWNTEAEFKDIKVTAPDGKVLFTSDFSNNSDGWTFLGDGKWTVQDGVLRQTEEKEFVRAHRRRQIVDRLHPETQSPQAGWTRRFFGPLPYQQRRRPCLVEHRGLEQHPEWH